MKAIADYQRRAFLKDHPPVMERKLIASSGTEFTILAGTVLGLKNDKHEPWKATSDSVSCILAEDVTVPASGDVYGLAYVHAAVIGPELIWADGVSATDQTTALAKLRAIGLYASEA